ncbi:MAG: hypothetical protein M1828_001696 [Chrysothrix sp. TS-e1954]|nr:MAG: hypothetical protein M1828_001696 [Chrysothrix sp. TS-e1954]
MSWWNGFMRRIECVVTSHRVQLLLTAALSGTAAIGLTLAYQNASKISRIEQLKSSIPEAERDKDEKTSTNALEVPSKLSRDRAENGEARTRSPHSRHDTKRDSYDDDLILEQLARTRAFLGTEGLERIRSTFVIIVGCGGVGSHAATTLARSGVGKLRLIDFDQVTLSSLNRHAVASLEDVGTPKVLCLQKRLRQITPWIKFDCRNEVFNNGSAESQLSRWDDEESMYVIDAIDNIDSKVDLLSYCFEHKIPVISSMGAGTKSDPTRVFVGDISMSNEDPLSRSIRRRLRARGIIFGIPTVFSDEKMSPDKARLLPLDEEEFAKGAVRDLGVLPEFRIRILPVLGTMPAVFGVCLANHILLETSGYPHEYSTGKAREKLYEGILASLQASEERLVRSANIDPHGLRIPVSQKDVGYIVDEIYRGRSALSGLTARLTLIRWTWSVRTSDPSLTSICGNQKAVKLNLSDLVVMTKEEAVRHQEQILQTQVQPKDFYEADIINIVQQRKGAIEAYATLR